MHVYSRPEPLTTTARTIVVALLMVLMALLAPGASAQGTEEPSEPSQSRHGALAELLEDEQGRRQLIDELHRLAAEESPESGSDERESLATRLAQLTQLVAQQLVNEFVTSAEAVGTLIRGETGLALMDAVAAATGTALLILATLGIFLLMRFMVRGIFQRLDRWSRRRPVYSPLLRRGLAVVAAIGVDVFVILVAWILGYLFALFVLGARGVMEDHQSLFLNAFLAVEAFKMLMRGVFASRNDGLRLLPLDAEEAAYWNAWLARVTGFIGYGMLFVVPLTESTLSPQLGRLAAILIMLVAFLYALTIILQNRDRVAANLRRRAIGTEQPFNRVLLGILARSWHWAFIAYFAALCLVTLVRPDEALPFMLTATVQTMAAIGGGIFLSVVLTEIIHRRFRLPEETRQRFPTLELRLNSYIPNALKVMRALIVIAVGLLVLDAWSLFDLPGWLMSEAGIRVLGTVVTVALILLVALAIWLGLASWIEQRLTPEASGRIAGAREKTLLTIFRNAAAVSLTVLTLMVVLAEIGINIGPLIAGAGVLGLAIGFGSQKLVQDIINGVFIQMENAINTGDIVTAGGITGEVEKLTIRSLGLRDLAGTYHIIPFSAVDTVSNYMRGFAYHLGEYGVAYREDIDEVMDCLREAFAELKTASEFEGMILEEELEIAGVTKFDDSSVNIRIRIKTMAGQQWAIGRAFNRLVKRHFDAADIEIPFPHTTLYFGQDKNGSAPPARVHLQQEANDSKPNLQPDDGPSDTSKGGEDAGDTTASRS